MDEDRSQSQAHTPDTDEEVLVYVPEDRPSPFRWSIVIGLIVLWLTVLACAIFLKAGMFRVLLPAVMVILIVYLGICSIYLLKASKS